MEFTGKVVLITGAGSGIGKATALLFAGQGAKIIALSRTLEQVEETAREVESLGGEALPLAADISVREDLQRTMRTIEDRWGRLDVVFAHAGINGVLAPLDEISPDEWEHTIRINLTGTFLTLHYAIPLLKRVKGNVIITSSINGNRKFTSWGSGAYSSSKAAQIALMKIAALELAPFGVRVNAVCPGAIDTEIEDNTRRRKTDDAARAVEFPNGIVPLTNGHPGTPEQVARVVLFLASPRADHVTGTEIYVDGAQSLLQG
jgi:NAD(P)-dependent dehydrogenase (short-subunit alcohol dehydrogenase family)